MTNGGLMKVESIAECSPWSIMQYFWLALIGNLSWKPIFGLFDSGRFRQVLLYLFNNFLLDSLPPINNLSVKQGLPGMNQYQPRINVSYSRTTTQWRQWGSNPLPLGLESSTLPVGHCAPIYSFITCTYHVVLLIVYHDDNGSQGNQGILVFYSFITCTYHVVLLIVYHYDNSSQGNQSILVFYTFITCTYHIVLLIVYHDDNGSQGNQGILVFYTFITCTYHIVLLIVYHDDNGSQGNQGILVFY